MPLYEYQCDTCGPFEQWHTLSEVGKPVTCSTCEGESTRRIYSPPSVMLNSSLRLKAENSEPTLVSRSKDREPTPRRYQSHGHGRPWMISH